jgi:MFS family permease
MKPMNKVPTNTSRYKWEILVLLWVAYLLNQADRQVFNVVLPLIREDLGLTDVAVGSIATIFNLAYALLVPVAGYAGDIFSRKWIVTISILFWSVATMLTGLSNGILLLIFTRSLATGGGEAFFGPANYSLLAQYHDKTRAFAMSIHQTAYYIGIILSGYVAGIIGEAWGWRSTFYVFGAVGVVHGIVMAVRLKDKKEIAETNEDVSETGEMSGFAKKEVKTEKIRFREGFKVVFGTPTALTLTLCFSGLIFVLTGYLTWMPTYLYETFQMSLPAAGFHSMFYTHLFAFIGIILAGKLSDGLGGKNPARRMMMQGMGLLIAVPFIVMMGNSSTLIFIYTGFAGFGFARAFFDANTYTVLYDVIPAKYHSSASGIMIMTGFAVGAFAPVALGYIKSVLGLSFGISSLAIIWLICGIAMIVAAKYFYFKDYEKKKRYEA